MTVIGVVSGLGPDGFLMSHRNYIDAIVAVGGSPIMIPAMVDPDDALKPTERIDALLLLSGGDIHPRHCGGTPPGTAPARTRGCPPVQVPWW